MNFVFDLPTKVIFGPGKLASIRDLIREQNWRRVLVVTDRLLRQSSAFAHLQSIIDEKQIEWAVFDGVESNPSTEMVEAAMELQKEFHAEAILGFGGGSSIDVAKAVAALSTNRKGIDGILGKEKIDVEPLPLIAVPTTAGTGSEVSMACVLEDPVTRMKRAIHSQKIRPKFAIEDPMLLAGVPRRVAAETGMDTLTHLIEGYVSKGASAITDALALDGIERASRHIRAFVADRTSLESASEMMYAALLGGVVLTFARTGLAHTLTRPFGARISHGLANAIALPLVMRFNLESAREKYALVAQAMGGARDPEAAIQIIQALNHDLGIPSKLEGTFQREEIPSLAENAFELDLSKQNPRSFTIEDLACLFDQFIK